MINNRRLRGVLWQAAFLAGFAGLGYWLASNALANLEARRISTGFAFLLREAGFSIPESVIPYAATDTYLRALAVGLANTIRVSLIVIVLATILGFALGVVRTSRNPLVAAPAQAFVEFMRNVPLVVQLLFWYGVFTITLPSVREAAEILPGVLVSNRGFFFPLPQASWPVFAFAAGAALAAAAFAANAAIGVRRSRRSAALAGAFATLAVGSLALFSAGVDYPAPRGLNIRGGFRLTPELAALILGLTLYTTAFIGEIVRSGVQSVAKGQFEAGAAIGLSPAQTMRFVVLPQALRVVIPPLSSQFINTFKNSSLAVVVGFPDIVSVANTTMNQTNQAVEGILIIMAVFLTINLTVASLMNGLNRAVALKER